MRKSIWFNPKTNQLAITSWSFEGNFGLGLGREVNPNTWEWIGEL